MYIKEMISYRVYFQLDATWLAANADAKFSKKSIGIYKRDLAALLEEDSYEVGETDDVHSEEAARENLQAYLTATHPSLPLAAWLIGAVEEVEEPDEEPWSRRQFDDDNDERE